jgi:hypothetical protein
MSIDRSSSSPRDADLAEIRRFFIEGGSVCPYAQHAAKQDDLLCVAPAEGELLHEALLPSVRRFAQREGTTLITMPHESPATHDEAREIVNAYFLALAIAFTQVNIPAAPLDEIRRAVEAEVLPLLEPSSDRWPHLSVGDSPLYTIGMSPLYDPQHPRYAPRLLLSTVWQSDVMLAPERIRERIRAVVYARVGTIYDGNALYLMPGEE